MSGSHPKGTIETFFKFAFLEQLAASWGAPMRREER